MNRHYILVLFALLLGPTLRGQASVQEYLQVAAGFTESRQHLEAVKVCDKLAATYPDNADVFFLRGINHFMLNDFQKAIADFTETLDLDPDYPDAHLYRAKARKANKDYLGALRDYNQAKDQNFSQTVTSLAGDMIRSLFSDKKD